MNVTPMLAHAGKPDDLALPGYVWSPKLDGVRCVAHISGGTIMLINRRDRDITHRYPDIVTGLHDQFVFGQPERELVLDGELVAYDEKGLPSFTLIAQRDQSSRPATIEAAARRIPAWFAVFDVLQLDGEDVRSYPLSARLQMLENLAAATAWRFPLQRVEHFEDGKVLWDVICAQGMEGVVGKHRDSRYTGKRDRAWLKVKCLHRISCVVTSYEPGEGGRAGTVGALFLSLFDGGRLMPVGKVGTGFNARSLAECKELLDAGQPFIAEVECLSLGSGGQLRHPSFKGIRNDLSPADVTVAQLETLPRT